MLRLPHAMVLDFCEWLHSKVASDPEREADAFDIILNEEYFSRLVNYTDEFLASRGNYTIRKLLHQFIDSKEFADCLRHCHQFRSDNYSHHRIHPDELRIFLHECSHCKMCEYHFEEFLQHTKHYSELSPRDLAYYVTNSIAIDDEPMSIALMSALKVDMSVEIEFLEWVAQTRGKPIKLNDMPLLTFEALAEEYREDCHKVKPTRSA